VTSPINHDHANGSHHHQNASAASSSTPSATIENRPALESAVSLVYLSYHGTGIVDGPDRKDPKLSKEEREQPALFIKVLPMGDKNQFIEAYLDSLDKKSLVIAKYVDEKIQTLFFSPEFARLAETEGAKDSKHEVAIVVEEGEGSKVMDYDIEGIIVTDEEFANWTEQLMAKQALSIV